MNKPRLELIINSKSYSAWAYLINSNFNMRWVSIRQFQAGKHKKMFPMTTKILQRGTHFYLTRKTFNQTRDILCKELCSSSFPVETVMRAVGIRCYEDWEIRKHYLKSRTEDEELKYYLNLLINRKVKANIYTFHRLLLDRNVKRMKERYMKFLQSKFRK